MRYGKLSKGVIISERNGGGKMSVRGRVNEIIDKELFDL